jgi:hypothetical protein
MARVVTVGTIRFGVALCACLLFGAGAARAQTVRQITASGTGVLQPGAVGSDVVAFPEIDDFGIDDADADAPGGDEGFLNRVLSPVSGTPASGNAGRKAKSSPEVAASFDGLNFRQQRLANGGNQFSVEPPDQALCVGNGFVLESVNDVLNVYDGAGNQLLGVTDLNTFYGYPPAIKRGVPNRFGPSITDPTCLFDSATQRWFHVVLTLDRINVDPATGLSLSQSLSGLNHLDIAVSNGPSPLGAWTIYRVPVQDDGTQGTPDHHCRPTATTPAGRTNPRACLGDYPHIGADANGFYVTTNEFNLFTAGFHAAQIYAFSKAALAAGAPAVTMFQYDTIDAQTLLAPGVTVPGFTVIPATSSASGFATDAKGTEWFLSTLAVFQDSGVDDRVVLWALTNTRALAAGAAPTLSSALVGTVQYSDPPRAAQPGTGTNDQARQWPLGQCIENAACNLFLNGIPAGVPETIGVINSNDSRMGQVTYANGKLWGAFTTGIATATDPTPRAGAVFLVLQPQLGVKPATVKGAKIVQQGYIALDGASLVFPTAAATESGRGVVSFTLTGAADFPSVAYAPLDALVGAGDVRVVQAGVGLQDGFSEYTNVFGGRPRWGDYGAAAVDGNSIWFATEYIAQSCDLATYEAGFTAAFGSCGGTRTSLGNWATRVTKVVP